MEHRTDPSLQATIYHFGQKIGRAWMIALAQEPSLQNRLSLYRVNMRSHLCWPHNSTISSFPHFFKEQ